MAAAVIMPDLKGLTRAQVQAALKKAGLKKPAYRVEYYTKAKYKKEYPGMKYRRCIKQNAAAGELVDKSRKIIVTFSGKTLETEKGWKPWCGGPKPFQTTAASVTASVFTSEKKPTGSARFVR